MANAISFPIKRDNNKSHSTIDVPSNVRKKDIDLAFNFWKGTRAKNKARSRSLGIFLSQLQYKFD